MLKELQKEQFSNTSLEQLTDTVLEMNKFYDKNLKKHFQEYKIKTGITLNSFQRKMLRYYYYYKNEQILYNLNIQEFPTTNISESDVDKLNNNLKIILSERDNKKIINSIKRKLEENDKINNEIDKSNRWLADRKLRQQGYSHIVINIDNKLYNEYEENFINRLYEIINYSYNNLENYRHISLVFKKIFDKNGVDITWDILTTISIYMENFVQYEGIFRACNKDKKIEELHNFISENKNLDSKNLNNVSKEFYKNISTGFSFTDLLVSEEQETKILIMRKIKKDETPIMCPSCLEKTGKGNSYPLMFLRSWECGNPGCPERSKSGRGKRYDEFGVYRYFKLVEANKNNIIDNDMYSEWRKDIFSENADYLKMLIKYYSYNDESLLFINDNKKYINIFERKIQNIEANKINSNYITLEELPIYKLMSKIRDNISIEKNEYKFSVTKKNNIILGNSTNVIHGMDADILGTAITSPPYYNAREYSQWPTFITYLIDMMINAKSIYDKLDEKGTYLYNVGDIVDIDNIYVNSNMSLRRIMLGFYSMLIFKIVGYNIAGNIIWDKGEVQSKRNSTVNLFSGYVRYVNCYEHVIVFKKSHIVDENNNRVVKIKPVYKINCKGENTLGHTAPYPEEIVALSKDYIIENKYILDPYLGSGTTGIWCNKNNINFIGVEMNNNYYDLARQRIDSSIEL